MNNNNKDQIEYCNILKTSTRETYNNIEKVFCPVLKEYVIFNARGFHHLLYKPDGTARDVCEIIYKMTLFPLAVPVIKNSVGISDEREIEIRENRKKNTKIKKAKTYALVAVVGKRNPVSVRVIVLKIGTGNYMFLSIMKD
jgi:hypothetical protein